MEQEKKPLREQTPAELWESTKDFFHDLVDLKEGMDQKGTLQNIHNNKKMRGSNAWLLMCSIMVASLGLDLNSPAVIIGAMLISPLMSPILGVGLGIGVNDKKTLFTSLKHFGLAIAIALITSFIYFRLTPFGNITDEIMSRTSPTLLDGLVAIFGGLAGVISITRMDKSNAIPGVAIATALMPPLCVAGYGLAKGEWLFFLNAFYLFFLNSFFIAITTYFIIRLLGFPYKLYMTAKERNRNRLYISLFSFVILIPAITILYNTVKKVKEEKAVEFYLQEMIASKESIVSDWTLVDNNLDRKRDSIQLVLKIIGEPLSQEFISQSDNDLERLLNKKVDIITYQSEELPIEDIQRLQNQISGFEGEIQQKLKTLEDRQLEKTAQVAELSAELDSLESVSVASVYKEVNALFPSIKQIAIAREASKSDFDTIVTSSIVIVEWDNRLSTSSIRKEKTKLNDFLKLRMRLQDLELYSK
jgi:uncharacterized hydrophobic protein (TIGR00271 family)